MTEEQAARIIELQRGAEDRRRDIRVLAAWCLYTAQSLGAASVWTREILASVRLAFGPWPPRYDELNRELHALRALGHATLEVKPNAGRGGWRRNYWALTDAGVAWLDAPKDERP